MGRRPHPFGLVRQHLLPSVETAMASLAFAVGPDCRPSGKREDGCPMRVLVVVADPRTTTDVLVFVRSLVQPGVPGPRVMPPFSEIKRQDSSTVVVQYLRN